MNEEYHTNHQLNSERPDHSRNVFHRSEVLRERPEGGWHNVITGRNHKSAWHAFRAVRKRDKNYTRWYPIVVTQISWFPCSYAGRLAVKVVTGQI